MSRPVRWREIPVEGLDCEKDRGPVRWPEIPVEGLDPRVSKLQKCCKPSKVSMPHLKILTKMQGQHPRVSKLQKRCVPSKVSMPHLKILTQM